MKKIVLIPQAVHEQGVAYLTERGYEVRHGTGIEKETLVSELRGCHAALLRTAVFGREVIASADCLEVISKHGAGVDNIDVAAATERGVKVTNAPLGMTDAVAEHAFAMLLALTKNLIPCDRAFRETADFSLRYRFENTGLSGKTMGIWGMGRIGAAMARRALAFGMRVIAYDPFAKPELRLPEVEYTADRNEVLRRSDVFSIHIPLTGETRHILGAEEFSKIKPGAIFLNVSRGELVDEEALVRALQSGRLRGAGLDVFEQEPPSKELPFFEMNNVIVSPHNSALTGEAVIRMAVEAAQGIDEVLSGKPVTWPVNF